MHGKACVQLRQLRPCRWKDVQQALRDQLELSAPVTTSARRAGLRAQVLDRMATGIDAGPAPDVSPQRRRLHNASPDANNGFNSYGNAINDSSAIGALQNSTGYAIPGGGLIATPELLAGSVDASVFPNGIYMVAAVAVDRFGIIGYDIAGGHSQHAHVCSASFVVASFLGRLHRMRGKLIPKCIGGNVCHPHRCLSALSTIAPPPRHPPPPEPQHGPQRGRRAHERDAQPILLRACRVYLTQPRSFNDYDALELHLLVVLSSDAAAAGPVELEPLGLRHRDTLLAAYLFTFACLLSLCLYWCTQRFVYQYIAKVLRAQQPEATAREVNEFFEELRSKSGTVSALPHHARRACAAGPAAAHALATSQVLKRSMPRTYHLRWLLSMRHVQLVRVPVLRPC